MQLDHSSSSVEWRLDRRWVVRESAGAGAFAGAVGAPGSRRVTLVWSPEARLLDSHVRKWFMYSSRGGQYVVESRSLAEDVAVAVRLALRSWSYQGYQRRRRLRSYLEVGIRKRLKDGRRMSLMTLTFPEGDVWDWWAAFRLLIKQLRKRYPASSFEYCGSRAFGVKNGVLHGHVVVECGHVPVRELSALWERLTGFPVVDIREVKSEGAADYVAKQVSGYVGDQGTGRMLKSKGWCTDGEVKAVQAERSKVDAGGERGAASAVAGT